MAPVIEVRFHRGLFLPELDLWLDPWNPKSSAFVSHAHADHFSRHDKALCSDNTAKLLRKRFGMAEARLQPLAFGEMIERAGFRLRLLPAGHIVGSAMLHVTRVKDGATLLYTGDFKARRGRTTEAVNFIQADTLIMETTFGLPQLIFPNQMEVEASVLRFVHDAFADGEVPVLFGYSLGKAQEALALMAEHGIQVLLQKNVAEMTAACRELGVDLPEPVLFEGFAQPGQVVIAPPNAVSSKLLRGLKNKRCAMLSGWAMQPGAMFRYRVDEVIPMSDHADHAGLMECVTRVRPKRVLTVHGYAKEFAAELRAKGLEAWCAMGGDQLELSLGKASHRSAVGGGAPRQIRAICGMADFTDSCRLVGETSSRIAKIDYLANYLKGLQDEDDLRHATRWLTGEALPRRGGKRVLSVGHATIKRMLLSLPGVKEERYREISMSQNDPARTTRLLLQEIPITPEPVQLSELYQFFEDLSEISAGLDKVAFISKRLLALHPMDSETLIRLLTGDLRIGLKDGLVEESLSLAFAVDISEIRKANMLLGDLGETAVLARRGDLATANLRPLVPLRCMLASPLERNPENDRLEFASLPFPFPLWAEPKYDGIRAQLHKVGDQIGLFSRDLRPMEDEFPELIEAARSLNGDFVMDGELIAYAAGRRLGFHDLQKRLGKKRVEGDLFSEANGMEVPLRYVAFDLLWFNGEDLLNRPLSERRAHLEQINPTGLFGLIGLFHPADEEQLEKHFKDMLQSSHEGLIIKDPDGIYSPGRRGKSWIKLKGMMPTLDCVVVAAEQGHGRRVDVLSDYTFAVRDEKDGALKILGKAYSGLTDLEIEDLSEHFTKHTLSKERRKRLVEPNVVLEIAFDSIRRSTRHDSGLALRFPRIKAIRRDKGIEDIDSLQAAEKLLP